MNNFFGDVNPQLVKAGNQANKLLNKFNTPVVLMSYDPASMLGLSGQTDPVQMISTNMMILLTQMTARKSITPTQAPANIYESRAFCHQSQVPETLDLSSYFIINGRNWEISSFTTNPAGIYEFVLRRS